MTGYSGPTSGIQRPRAVVTRVCNGILTISYVARGEITRPPVIIIDEGGERAARPEPAL